MKKSSFRKKGTVVNRAFHTASEAKRKKHLTSVGKAIQGSANKTLIVAKPLTYDKVSDELREAPMGVRIGVLEANGVKTLVPYSQVILAHMRANETLPLSQEEALQKFDLKKRPIIIQQIEELSSRGISCWFGLRPDGLVSIRTDEGAGIWAGPQQ